MTPSNSNQSNDEDDAKFSCHDEVSFGVPDTFLDIQRHGTYSSSRLAAVVAFFACVAAASRPDDRRMVSKHFLTPFLLLSSQNASVDQESDHSGDGFLPSTDDAGATVAPNKENVAKHGSVAIHDSRSKLKNVTPSKGTSLATTKILLLEDLSNITTTKHVNRVSLEPTNVTSPFLTCSTHKKASPSLPTINEDEVTSPSDEKTSPDAVASAETTSSTPNLSDPSAFNNDCVADSDLFEDFLAEIFPSATDHSSFDDELIKIFEDWNDQDEPFSPKQEEEVTTPSPSAVEESSSEDSPDESESTHENMTLM